MARGLRSIVNELMIYDADDELSVDEAKEFKATYQYGPWAVDARGVQGIGEISLELVKFFGIEQLVFCCHGFSGGIHFKNGDLYAHNMTNVYVDPTLFKGPGRLLFESCEAGSGNLGVDFLITAGRHFFAGKGGIVGGSTVPTRKFSTDTRIRFDWTPERIISPGALILFQLDAMGNVINTNSTRPFGP